MGKHAAHKVILLVTIMCSPCGRPCKVIACGWTFRYCPRGLFVVIEIVGTMKCRVHNRRTRIEGEDELKETEETDHGNLSMRRTE